MEKVNSAVSAYSTLVQTIAVPHERKPMRVPTFPNVERTSILSFTTTTTTSVPAWPGKPQVSAIVARDPAVPLWLRRFGTPLGGYHAVGWTCDAALPNSRSTVALVDPMLKRPAEYLVALGGRACNFNGYGRSAVDGSSWAYLPAGMIGICILQTTGDASAFTGSMVFQYTTSFDLDNIASVTVATTAGVNFVQAQLSVSGVFWRPVLLSSTAGAVAAQAISKIRCYTLTAGTLAVPLPCPNAFLDAAEQPPEATVAPAVYNACRLNAVGVLFSNSTAVLSKEGTAEGVLLTNAGSDPNNYLGDVYFSDLSLNVTAKNRYFGLLEKGLYTYALPDNRSAAFTQAAVTVADPAGTVIPVFTLGGLDYVNLICFTDYGAPDTTLAITIDRHIEFRNSTMLWPIGFSMVPLEDWHRSQIALQELGVFFENWIHLATIANLARAAAMRVAPYLIKYGRPVATAALSAAKDKVMSMASNAMSTRFQKPQVALNPTVTKFAVKKTAAGRIKVQAKKKKK